MANTTLLLATILPTLSVSVRRLRDLDRSGWWILLDLVPLVGWIILLVWFCYKGTDGPNRFGPDRLASWDKIIRDQHSDLFVAEKPAGRFTIRSRTRVVQRHPKGDW